MSTDESRSVGAVVGENIRRLREARGWTQQEIALRFRSAGLDWSRHQVAAIEIGRREDVGLSTLPHLVRVLGVSPAELVAGDGLVRLDADATMPLGDLRALLATTYREPRPVLEGAAAEAFAARLAGAGLDADERLAERLGVSVGDVLDAAERRWGRSLTEERDRRVAQLGGEAGDRRARRGHITRQLSAELEQEITDEEE